MFVIHRNEFDVVWHSVTVLINCFLIGHIYDWFWCDPQFHGITKKKRSQNNISYKMILNEIFAKISLHHSSKSCLIDHLAIEIWWFSTLTAYYGETGTFFYVKHCHKCSIISFSFKEKHLSIFFFKFWIGSPPLQFPSIASFHWIYANLQKVLIVAPF